jgi:AcrR family transcriptional regulator
MSTATGPRRGRGRPADPDIEQRVLTAAIEVYAEVGWAGFTFDAIAARSGVGKAAIYRRWESKLDILRAAWRAASVGFVRVPDTGDLRSDLVLVARTLMERLDEPVGIAEVRVLLDVKLFPEEFADFDHWRAASRAVARETVDRAVAHGDLPAGTRPEFVFDLVSGAAVHNFLMVPPGMADAWRARRAQFAEEIVDLVLAGLRARGTAITAS